MKMSLTRGPFSSALSLHLHLPSISRRPPPTFSSCLSDSADHVAPPDPDHPVLGPSKRASHQLNRWSRARTVRSGRRLEWLALRNKAPTPPPPPTTTTGEEDEEAEEGDDDGGGGMTSAEGKAIYMVSDGTGWTAEHSVNAALGQFEHCLVDRGCPVNTHLFSGVILSFSSPLPPAPFTSPSHIFFY